MKKIIAAGAGIGMFMVFAVAATAADEKCSYGGIDGKQIVPNEKVAGEIFHAIVGGYSSFLLRRYPDITVTDGGDHWIVSQMNLDTAQKKRMDAGGEMVTLPKKGQLSLLIDKCIGTVTKATIHK